jgi:alkanesulfonate monooxygenase SsuD/methylene tetrahydromethanopterin reductase-like flavin-dependent oxidoreductase (luciferase family)
VSTAGEPLRLGVVILPEYPAPDPMRAWRHVEQLGVDHAWTFDHLSWRTLRARPWFDAMTTLSAAAMVTDRIHLGTLVASPNFRHPATLASQAMTLDHLSGGRFTLGIGAGAPGPDSTALGGEPLAPGGRTARFEEFVTLTDLLLRQPVTTFRGEHFTAIDVPMAPGCVRSPRVPFAIAAAGPRGMRVAVEHADIWVTIGDPGKPGGEGEKPAFDTLRRQLEQLAAIRARSGRDPASLRKLVNLSRVVADPYASVDRFADLVGRCADLGFSDVVVNYPRPDGIFAGDPAGFDRAMTQIAGAVTTCGGH